MSKIYIHYGHKYFASNKFVKVKNRMWNKPEGGLWASDIKAKYGWKNWCKDENYSDCTARNSFCFTLKENSKVLIISSHDDLNKLPLQQDVPEYVKNMCLCIDFEKLVIEYDAIEVIVSKDDRLYYDLYGWDCDSLLVLNKECIDEIWA